MAQPVPAVIHRHAAGTDHATFSPCAASLWVAARIALAVVRARLARCASMPGACKHRSWSLRAVLWHARLPLTVAARRCTGADSRCVGWCAPMPLSLRAHIGVMSAQLWVCARRPLGCVLPCKERDTARPGCAHRDIPKAPSSRAITCNYPDNDHRNAKDPRSTSLRRKTPAHGGTHRVLAALQGGEIHGQDNPHTLPMTATSQWRISS